MAVFAATSKVTVPFPVPLAPVATVTHPALLVAVHAQLVVVVTATLPEPPAAANDCDVGEMLKAQGAGAAAWVTVKV